MHTVPNIHKVTPPFYSIMMILALSSCTKLISISPPISTITTAEVFADSADATAALLGVYSNLSNTGGNFSIASGAISMYTGLSSDELVDFGLIGANYVYINQVTSQLADIDQYFWTPGYNVLYGVNACIAGVTGAANISQPSKNEILAESKFIRAFINFNLVNLFGGVPLVTTTSYKTNALLPRASIDSVYASIVSDLYDAYSVLPGDYSVSAGARIRANKWAAAALLARVYLYENILDSAEEMATAVINNSNLFALEPTPNTVFSINSKEAILQWNLNPSQFPYNCTIEGYNVVPTSGNYPYYYISNQLLSSFEPGDIRRVNWVDSITYSGVVYYYPYKYKNGPDQLVVNGSPTEYYTVLRLAEQYLIRAEARLGGGSNILGAIDDINIIRTRAGLNPLSHSITNGEASQALAHERQIELFAEWGHRWFDLKRTHKIDSVMTIVTPQKNGGKIWVSNQQLYPIPLSELQLNPNLIQNFGY
jgi:starch-binding outer membrane protein, SusD/RagB family